MGNYNKLVRDRIPEILEKAGVVFTSRVLDDSHFEGALQVKLIEESHELLRDGTVEELADVIEVVEGLKRLPKFQNVEQVRLDKLREKGGFEKRFWISE